MWAVLLLIVAGIASWIVVKNRQSSDIEIDHIQKRINAEEQLEQSIQECSETIEQVYGELNQTFRKEFDAWEERFCSEENPGYRIAGINYQKLKDSHLGAFKGHVVREDWNAYDPNALAIYRGKKKVGYIPKEYSTEVIEKFTESVSKLPCYGCIYAWYNDEHELRFAGKISFSPLQSVVSERDE